MNQSIASTQRNYFWYMNDLHTFDYTKCKRRSLTTLEQYIQITMRPLNGCWYIGLFSQYTNFTINHWITLRLLTWKAFNVLHGTDFRRHFLPPFSGYKSNATVGKGVKDTEKFDCEKKMGDGSAYEVLWGNKWEKLAHTNCSEQINGKS
jgi:hypothetical protein